MSTDFKYKYETTAVPMLINSNGTHGLGRSLIAVNARDGAVKMFVRTPTEVLSDIAQVFLIWFEERNAVRG
jgi:hypothetical protein